MNIDNTVILSKENYKKIMEYISFLQKENIKLNILLIK